MFVPEGPDTYISVCLLGVCEFDFRIIGVVGFRLHLLIALIKKISNTFINLNCKDEIFQSSANSFLVPIIAITSKVN